MRSEDHIQALLRLPPEGRARAAKRLLESLADLPVAHEVPLQPGIYRVKEGGFRVVKEDEDARHGIIEVEDARHDIIDFLTGSAPDHGGLESNDELADLEDLVTDRDGLRAAVRAAVESELAPLHELTRLLQRFAELARTTGHALRARTA